MEEYPWNEKNPTGTFVDKPNVEFFLECSRGCRAHFRRTDCKWTLEPLHPSSFWNVSLKMDWGIVILIVKKVWVLLVVGWPAVCKIETGRAFLEHVLKNDQRLWKERVKWKVLNQQVSKTWKKKKERERVCNVVYSQISYDNHCQVNQWSLVNPLPRYTVHYKRPPLLDLCLRIHKGCHPPYSFLFCFRSQKSHHVLVHREQSFRHPRATCTRLKESVSTSGMTRLTTSRMWYCFIHYRQGCHVCVDRPKTIKVKPLSARTPARQWIGGPVPEQGLTSNIVHFVNLIG